MNTITRTLSLAVPLFAAVAACGGHRPANGQTTTTGAAVTTNQVAVQRITAAKCERDAACGQVEDKYGSRRACQEKNTVDLRDDLNNNRCRGGVDATQLDRCLIEIRNERCGNALDKISRLAACRTAPLCLD